MELQTPHAATRDAMAGWWPSRYGAGDEAGALNEITPGKVLEAIAWSARAGSTTWRTCCTRTSRRFPAGPSGST